jgi:hypothetical protein
MFHAHDTFEKLYLTFETLEVRSYFSFLPTYRFKHNGYFPLMKKRK